MPELQSLGPAFSIATAVCWAVAVLLFKKSGEVLGPVALNYFKNVVGLALFAITLAVVRRSFMSNASPGELWILLASGALGIGVADSLFFYGLNILGAGRLAIVECLYSPFVVLCSVLMLGEQVHANHLLGGACILLGVAIGARSEPTPPSRKNLEWKGIAATGLSMAIMAFAIVWAKPVLERHDVVWTTSVRLLGGVATLTLLLAVGSKQERQQVWMSFRPQANWRYALPGAVMGAYLALVLWIAGFKYTTATTASLLNQTSTLFIVILAAVFLREPLTKAKTLAVVLSFGGSALVLM